MLSMSRQDNGARRIAGSSLKFIVVGVFVNGKMAVSLPITCEPVFVLTRIAICMPESDEYLELKSSWRAVVSRTTRCPGVCIIKLSYNALKDAYHRR